MGSVMHFQRTLNLLSRGSAPGYLAVFIGGFGDVVAGCLSRVEKRFPGFLPGVAHATAYYHWDGGGCGVFLDRCGKIAAELEELRRKPGMRLDASQHYLGELTGAAAPFRYEGCVRRGILHTKYHAAPWAAVELGLWLAKLAFGSEMHMAGAEPVPELVEGMSLGYDCIVPVPSSGSARGYNVPQLMAVPLARALGIPLYPKALGRKIGRAHV